MSTSLRVILSDEEIVEALLNTQQEPLTERVAELKSEFRGKNLEIEELYEIHKDKIVELLNSKYSHELECLKSAFGNNLNLDFDNIDKFSTVVNVGISGPSISGYLALSFDLSKDELESMQTYVNIKAAENTLDQINLDIAMVKEELQLIDDKADGIRAKIKQYALKQYEEIFRKEFPEERE